MTNLPNEGGSQKHAASRESRNSFSWPRLVIVGLRRPAK